MAIDAERLGLRAEDLGERTWVAALAELIGTMLFVFLGCGSVVIVVGVIEASPASDPAALTAIAVAHGLAIAIMVAAAANISGGHINPAVTCAAVLTGKLKLGPGIVYVAAQLAGAVIGALLLKLIFIDSVEGSLGAHALNDAALDSTGAGVIVEVVLTFVLVYVVFATAMDPRGAAGNIAPLAIGFAILIDHLVGVPLTGASMNPARSFGPALVAGEWDDHWVFWVGPLVGAALAGLVYTFAFMNRPDSD